jgi:hypothetical protein
MRYVIVCVHLYTGYMKHLTVRFLLPEIQRCVTSHSVPSVTLVVHRHVDERRRCVVEM